MRNYYNVRLMMFSIMALVISSTKLFAQVNVTATAGTPAGTHATLNDAFAAINAGTYQGAITILITGNTTEPAASSALLASNGTTINYSSVLVQPSGGNWVINSAAAPTASRGVIELSGADNVTIDGDDPGTPGVRNLTIQVAPVATTGVAALRLASNSTTGADGANNCTVKNLIIIGSRAAANATVVNYGINMSNASSITTGAYSSLNTTIENNLITRCYRGIYANGSSNVYPNKNLIIRNNELGSTIASDNIGLNGIFVAFTNSNGASTACIIEGNKISAGDVSTSGAGYSAAVSGIEAGSTNANLIIRKNNISDILQPLAGGSGAYGIQCTSGTLNNNFRIENNFINNVVAAKANTTSVSANTAYGIRITSNLLNLEIIHNTIVLNAAVNGATANYTNYGVAITSTTATVSKFYNNIVVNNNIGTGTYGIYTAATGNISNSSWNNNDLYVPSGNIGFYNGASQLALSNWVAATGKDLSSISTAPNFVSTTDLHLTSGVSSLLESSGISAATSGTSVDFDNEARPGPAGSVNGGATNPDMGADEFDGIPGAYPVITFNSSTPDFTANCSSSVSRLISTNITTPTGTITGATLNVSFNGVAQTPIAMTNTGGSTWEGTIPVATPANATVTWYISATNSSSISTVYYGTQFQDQPLLGFTASIATATTNVCSGAPSVLTGSISNTTPTYGTPSIANPLVDEDFGSVVITQGATTILSNTTPGGSLTGTIGTATGVAGSYSNFTAFGPYTLNAGQAYNFALTSITQGGNFGNSMAIFIDFNHNGVYSDAGEMVYQPAGTITGPHTETGTFTIPQFAPVGATRMRVQVLETTITSAASTSSWGEYEEYTVYINNNGSISWSDGVSTIGTTASITVNPTANTTYTFTSNQAGCSVSTNVLLNVLPLPASPTATNSSQCGTQVPTASVASNAGSSGTGQYFWYNAATNGTVVQTPPATYTTFYSNDFTSSTIDAGASLNGSANLTAVPGQLQLTPNATSQLGGITVNAGVNALAYKVDFDFSTTPAGGADGFSYSFGDDVNAASTSPTAEMGSGTKFKVSFDSYGAMPNGAGIYILYNNTATSFNATTPGVLGYVANTSWVGTPNNHATIEINSQGQVTLTLNSTPLFTNVQLPAAYLSANKASWKHAIAARTGGISMEQLIDNLVIQTQSYSPGNTTYGSPVASTTTFYVSEVGTNGCYSATTPVTVTVLTPAEINSSVSETVSCVNVPITLMSEAPTASPAYTLSWESTPATGSGISGTISGDTITVTPTAGGTYTYIVTGTNGTCTDQDTLTVTINDFIPPAPTATTTNFNICAGTVSQLISTDPLASSGTQTVASGTVSLPINNLATTTSTLSMAGVPTGATITNMSVTFNATHTFDGDLDISLTGPNGSTVDLSSDNGGGNDNYVNTVFSNTASTAITAGTAPFTGTFLPEGNLTNLFSVPNGTYTLSVYDDASGDVGTINNWSISITYTIPPLSLVWYDAATAGNQVGSGTPYETVGSSVMPNTNTAGTYSFFATTESGGCLSATRLEFTVNVTEVLADLAPVNNTCNGGNTGSFTLGTIQCGSGNFLYSLTGGAPYGPIPTNLTAGTYSVTIQDQTTMGVSAPITVVITEPAAPSGLNATSVTYYDATLSWTENGSATSWTIIYGPTGFDPSTSGTVITGATNPYLLDNVLSAATSYQFYVFGECGPEADTSGPFTFATDQGFLTYDNQCTNYIDIQSSGTNLNLDDDTEAGVTLPFTFNYQNTGYTTLTVGNNGGLLLGTLTGNIGYGGNMTTLANNYIFAWGDDMDGETGDVFYQTVGTAPNQIAVFQWQNLNNFSNGAGTVTFQIQLFEATGEIYFVYQDVVFGATEAADNYAGNADIGISGATTDINVSNNNQTYLQNNSCVHFYNALCPNITNFNALIFPDEIDLSWNAGLYGETDWTVVYGYAGFDPTVSGEELGSFPYSTNYAQLTGLTQNTEYDVYIYSECMADNLTSDGYFYTFVTPPFCANPTTVAVGTDVDSLEVTWNWAEYDPAYPINHFNIMYEMNGVYSNEVVANGVNFADTVVDPMLIGSGVYQVYVQAVCDNAAMTEDTSTWVGPITVVMPLSNDTVCGAEMLEMDYVYTLNNAGATVSVDEINIAPPATGAQETDGWANSTLNNTVWYRFVAPPSGSVRINNTAIAYNGQLAVYNVADCGDFNSNFIMVGANDNEIDGTSLAPNFTICGLTPGSVYYVLHDGSGTTGNYSISISEIVLEAGSALPLTQICYGEILDLNTTISGNDAGGVWSSQIAAVNASITGSDFNSTGLGYNTYNFQYRMTDGCAYDSIISQVQVFAPVNPGTDGAITICKNEPINLFDVLTGTADFNGQWYTPANAATPADIVGAASGGTFTYSYVVGNGVCPDDTSNAVVTVLASCDYTSIDEALFAGVQLYPNPTFGVINIDADKAYDVEITDANGRVIKNNISTSAGTTSVDLGKVQVGVYFVTLRTNDISKVFRVVVQ